MTGHATQAAAAAANHLVFSFHIRSRWISRGSSELPIFPLPIACSASPYAPTADRMLSFRSAGDLRVGRRGAAERVQPGHVELQVLLQVLLQPRQLERAAQREHLA